MSLLAVSCYLLLIISNELFMADLSSCQNIATCAARLCLTAKNRRLLHFRSDSNHAWRIAVGFACGESCYENSRGVSGFAFARFA